MPSFAVEVYTAGLTPADMDALAARIRAAVEAVSVTGRSVRYVESIFFPPDELCLHLFEGPSAEAVGRTSEHAGLVPERVVSAVRSHGAGRIGAPDCEVSVPVSRNGPGTYATS